MVKLSDEQTMQAAVDILNAAEIKPNFVPGGINKLIIKMDDKYDFNVINSLAVVLQPSGVNIFSAFSTNNKKDSSADIEISGDEAMKTLLEAGVDNFPAAGVLREALGIEKAEKKEQGFAANVVASRGGRESREPE